MEKKKAEDLRVLERTFGERIDENEGKVEKLRECRPGFSGFSERTRPLTRPLTRPYFRAPLAPPAYSDGSSGSIVEKSVSLALANPNAQSRKWSAWEHFVDSTVADPFLNYLADKILIYLPSSDYGRAGAIFAVSKTFNAYSTYFTNRCLQAVVVQKLYRRAVAVKQLSLLKRRNDGAKRVQRNARKMLGRIRANEVRRVNGIHLALKTKMGAGSSVVKCLLGGDTSGSGSSEVFVAAASTLLAVASTAVASTASTAVGGTDFVLATDAPAVMAGKMAEAMRLNLAVNRTEGGKSDWVAFIELVGGLSLEVRLEIASFSRIFLFFFFRPTL